MVPVMRTLAPLVKLEDFHALAECLEQDRVPMKTGIQAIAQDCLEAQSTATVIDDCKSDVLLPSDGFDPAMDMYFVRSVLCRG